MLIRKIKKKMGNLRDKLITRYYRGLFAKCGENLTIRGKPTIYAPEKIFLGDNVTINGNVQLAPRGEIHIGNNVVFSRGAQITAGQLDTSSWDFDGCKGKKHIAKDVYIADGTWVCINAIILPGVHILGRGVIVAAGAVVTKDFSEDMVILGGVPARVVGHLNAKEETKATEQNG